MKPSGGIKPSSILMLALAGVTLTATAVTVALIIAPHTTRVERMRHPGLMALVRTTSTSLASTAPQSGEPALPAAGCPMPQVWNTTYAEYRGLPAALIEGTGPWSVDGNGPFHFLRYGVLSTPWGFARWQGGPSGREVHTDLCGEHWTLRFNMSDDQWSFTAQREDRGPPRRGRLIARRRAISRILRSLPTASELTSIERALVGTGGWLWGGGGYVAFLRGGYLHTPWAAGTWRVDTSNATLGPALVAGFLANDHILSVNGVQATSGAPVCWELSSRRVRDGDVIRVWLDTKNPPLASKGPARSQCAWKPEEAARPVVQTGSSRLCEPRAVPPAATTGEPGAAPRVLHRLHGTNEPFPTNCGEEGGRLEPLCDALRRVGSNREVLAAVSNKNIFDNLGLFLDALALARVPNAMVVALDQETAEFVEDRGVPAFFRPLRTRTGDTSNHATSGLKFRILLDFLKVGASVLLSDVDVVFFQSPFPFLHRDADFEGMVDGWEDRTAFGHQMTAEDSRGASAAPESARHLLRTMRISHFNSGFFYVQPTHEARALLARVAARMDVEAVWDQTAYNEELFLPSRDGLVRAGVLVRGMSYLCVVHSKMLFHRMRSAPDVGPEVHRPFACHVSWHPEKFSRMADIISAYHHGNATGLQRWALPYEGLTDLITDIEPANNISGALDSIRRTRERNKAEPAATGQGACLAQPVAQAARDGFAADAKSTGDVAKVILGEYVPPLDRIAVTGMVSHEASRVLGADIARWAVARGVAREPVVLVHCVASTAGASSPFAERAAALGLSPAIISLPLSGDCDGGPLAWPRRLPPPADPGTETGARAWRWAVIGALLADGVPVLSLTADLRLARSPLLGLLHGDSDVEVLSEGWDDLSAYGYDHVADDPPMGWSRFHHATRVAFYDPEVIYLQPTQPAFALSARMARRLRDLGARSGDVPVGKAASSGVEPADERGLLNDELFRPSRPGIPGASWPAVVGDSTGFLSAGVKVRVINWQCIASLRAAKVWPQRMFAHAVGVRSDDATSRPSAV
mmetsp:Transcript_6962/g.18932  ORF Transcript_6962/g.18932 Transcript_6962/m.18932 type:complete len:1036 (+) Transcript_6962:119-3226(+)